MNTKTKPGDLLLVSDTDRTSVERSDAALRLCSDRDERVLVTLSDWISSRDSTLLRAAVVGKVSYFGDYSDLPGLLERLREYRSDGLSDLELPAADLEIASIVSGLSVPLVTAKVLGDLRAEVSEIRDAFLHLARSENAHLMVRASAAVALLRSIGREVSLGDAGDHDHLRRMVMKLAGFEQMHD